MDLGDLLDHVLDRHPKEMIATMRATLKEQAVEFTDVEFREADNGA
jgi:hypothetical protein